MAFRGITIFCAESSHEAHPYVVASFWPGEIMFGEDVDVPWQDWREGGDVDDRTNDAGIETAPATRRTGALLDDNAYTRETRDVWGNNDGPLRERFALRCPMCGLSSPARAEKLFPILDQLRRAGVHTITLAALAPRLS